jgi:hypothetical protein
MLYQRPRRWRLINLWLRMVVERRRHRTQDIGDLGPHLRRDLGLRD